MGRKSYSHCPHSDCAFHQEAPKDRGWYWHKGRFKTKWNGQPVPRYQCSECRRTFSSHTFRKSYRQKKPYLNERFGSLYPKGVTITDAARAQDAAKREGMKVGRYDRIQLDELETYEQTRLKPVSIVMAVTEDRSDPSNSGFILGFRVARMPCARRNGKVAAKKYGKREDERTSALRDLLREPRKQLLYDQIVISTDEKGQYRAAMRDEMPGIKHRIYEGQKIAACRRMTMTVDAEEFEFQGFSDLRQDEVAPYGFWTTRQSSKKLRIRPRDPLFVINQKYAKMRAGISRLRRRFWGQTRKLSRLEGQLWMFVAANNRYRVDWR